MTQCFKVSIPSGSLLEKELEGKKGRQRQQRLYFLAELGAEQLRGAVASVTQKEVTLLPKNQEVTSKKAAGVVFPASDLLSI